MAYRFKSAETVQTSVRRCLAEQAEQAIGALRSGVDSDPVKAVHDARKAIKKERSLLRLVRSGLKAHDRRNENALLRSLAHELGASRESDALVSALEGLTETFAGNVPPVTLELVHGRLRADQNLARAALADAAVPSRVAGEFERHLDRVRTLNIDRGGWSSVSDGLERGYRRGRRAMRRARKSPDPERMHEWRKRSKDLYYQLRLLKQTSPGIVGGAAKDAHRLTDLLGDIHDLALLDRALRHISDDVPAADLEPLRASIDERREHLTRESFTVGERLYAEPPAAFIKRMRAYWHAWRVEFVDTPGARPPFAAAF